MEKFNPFSPNNPFAGYNSSLPSEEVEDIVAANAFMDKTFDEMTDEEKEKALDILVDALTIDPETWNTTYPFGLKSPAAPEYCAIATQIVMAVMELNTEQRLPAGTPLNMGLACAAYLDDFVSGFGVWNAIRHLFKAKLGGWLPFYDTAHDDYLTDDINIEDVYFLIWQTLNRCGSPEGRFFSPYSELVEMLGQRIMDTLVEHVDDVTPNTRIARKITQVLKKGEYYETRELGEWISINNPLVAAPFASLEIQHNAQRLEEITATDDMFLAIYWAKSMAAWQMYSGPLGIYTSKYLAQMCRDRGFDANAKVLEDLKTVQQAMFEIEEYNRREIVFADMTGKTYQVTHKSLKGSYTKGDMLLTSLVWYGDIWWQNGIASVFGPRKELSDKPVPTFHITDDLKDEMQRVIDSHKGRRIFFFRDHAELNEFMRENLGFEGGLEKTESIADIDDITLMLSLTMQPIILTDMARAFKSKENPFYDKAWAKENALGVLMHEIPDDLAEYIEKKGLLGDATMTARQGKRFGKRTIQDNMRFLMAFFRTPSPAPDQTLP